MGLAESGATFEMWNVLIGRAGKQMPFYRDRLPARGIRSDEDISGLPFTTRDDLQQRYPLGMLAVPRNEVVRLHMSSGTTGRPVVTAYTRSDLDRWAECMARVLSAAEVNERDVLQNAYGYGLFTGGLGFHMGAERLGCTVIPTSVGVTQRQVTILRDLGTTILACTPSYALVLAEAIEQEGSLSKLQLRAGFFGGEPWTDGMRREIERGLGLEAFDVYGLTELGGPGVAVECHEHNGLHLFEDHFHVEVIDPQTSRPLPPGQAGELVLTSLRREASPIIRYRTGDRTALYDEPCACGNPFRRIRKVHGRTDDMLVVRGENVFPSQIEDVLLRIDALSGNYQVVVDRAARQLDSLHVRVETRPGADPAGLDRLVVELVKETIGLTVTVTVLAPGSLPRTQGKAQRLVDLRDLKNC